MLTQQAELQQKLQSPGENRLWRQPELSAPAKNELILLWNRWNQFASHTPIHFKIIFPLIFLVSGYIPVCSWSCYGTGS